MTLPTRLSRRRPIARSAALAAMIFSFGLAAVAEGQTLTVTSTANAGAGTLRDTIAAAPAGATIDFDAALFTGGTATITLSSTISISRSITLEGPSELSGDKLTIEGTGSIRLFTLAGGTDMNFRRIRFHRGYSSQGGAMWARFQSGMSILIEDCSFTDNVVTSHGGALFIEGCTQLQIKRCLFYNNVSNIHGGAVAITSTNSVIENCTFVDNRATTQEGGGVWRNSGNTYIVSIRYSTFVGNSSGSRGAAVLNKAYGAFATTSGSWSNHAGVELLGCLMHDNHSNSHGDESINSFTTLGYNLITNVGMATYNRPGDPGPVGGWTSTPPPTVYENVGDQLYSSAAMTTAHQNPQPTHGLDPTGLADNGGMWHTVALMPTSDAIDAGDPASTLAVDGRNFTRNVGIVDIGAFEFGAPNEPPAVDSMVGFTGTNPYVLTVAQGAAVNGSLTIVDPNGDVVDVTAVTPPTSEPLGLIAPSAGSNGTDTITLEFSGVIDLAAPVGTYDYVIDFEDGLTQPQSIVARIEVTPNSLPVVSEVPEEAEGTDPYVITVERGREFTFTFVVTDPDGDTITITNIDGFGEELEGMTLMPAVNDTGAGTLELMFEGLIEFSTPVGEYPFVLTISDGVAVEPLTFTVVLDVIQPPTFTQGRGCATIGAGGASTQVAWLLVALLGLLALRRAGRRHVAA